MARQLLPGPTALVHLLGVELLPVCGFAVASWSAAKKFMAREFLVTRYVERLPGQAALEAMDAIQLQSFPQSGLRTLQDHLECVNAAVVHFTFTYDATRALQCPGCGGQLECPESYAPVALPPLVFGALGLTGLLVAWIIGCFALRGLCLHRCGSGAYLHFTWELEQRFPYRALVRVMLAATVLTMAMMLLTVLGTADEGSVWSLTELVGMDAVALVVCLLRLLVPRTGIHHWIDGKQLGTYLFHRTWLKLPRIFP